VAWNQPGGGDKDPWGRRRAGSSDVDQLWRNFQRRLRGIFSGGDDDGSGGQLGVGLIVAVALVLWVLSGFYIVHQGERGVVLRFGAKAGVTDAGMRWHWPFPIERVEKVNVLTVSQLGIGYRNDPRSDTLIKQPREALMLTGDENIVDVGFNVQYQINDAEKYLFNVSNPETTIQQATESAVREVVGRSTLDFVLTEGREAIDSSVKELLQKILDRYDAGIYVVSVNMRSAQPPDEVRPAFDDVNKAREDRERKKNEAEAYANDVVPRARGDAARLIQEAEGYKASSIARAEGDARRFSQVASEYVKAPGVTRERLYIETMEQVFSNTTKVLVDQKGGNNLIYLPLDKIMNRSDGATDAGGAASENSAAPAHSDPGRRTRDRGVPQ
jgi:membrane protease subunit HflK